MVAQEQLLKWPETNNGHVSTELPLRSSCDSKDGNRKLWSKTVKSLVEQKSQESDHKSARLRRLD